MGSAYKTRERLAPTTTITAVLTERAREADEAAWWAERDTEEVEARAAEVASTIEPLEAAERAAAGNGWWAYQYAQMMASNARSTFAALTAEGSRLRRVAEAARLDATAKRHAAR